MKTGMRSFTLRARLMVFMTVVVMATVIFLSLQFYRISRSTLGDINSQNVLNLMSNVVTQVDQVYTEIEQASLGMLLDETLYEELKDIAQRGYAAYNQRGPVILEDLQKLFSDKHLVWSAEIMYGEYNVLYRKTQTVRHGPLRDTVVWKDAQERRGQSFWIGSWNLPSEIVWGDQLLICHMRSLNIINKSNYKAFFTAQEEAPVIMICTNGNYPRQQILKNIALDHVEYVLLGEDGSYMDGTLEAGRLAAEPLRDMGGRGICQVSVQGKNMLALAVRSQVTGWLHVILLDPEEQVGRIWKGMMKSALTALGVVMLVMSVVILMFSRSVVSPVQALVRKMQEIEAGKYGTQISYAKNDEFTYLIRRFNSMSERLHQLIDENYRVQLREKDSEIARLNIQFNPHWLYNTLNAIHWVISMGENKRADRMVVELSSLLRYTSDGREGTVPLREDIDWLKRYVLLMGMRYGGEIMVAWDIPEKLMDIRVLKLFLQPFIENSIIHGFRDRDFSGRIAVSAREDDDYWVFSVRDNGAGMDVDRLEGQITGQKLSGIMNVRRRLELIYGGEGFVTFSSRPGEGTLAIIRIPKKSTGI